MLTRSTCTNCKYYNSLYKDKGQCRRHPPVMIAGIGTKWPLVGVTDWCGELVDKDSK
jgi:hypothetical protein